MSRVVLSALVAVLLVAGSAVAAEPTSIATIVADGEAWNGRDVVVVGGVLPPAIGRAGEGVYTLFGDDRGITVFSAAGAPAAGDRLQVTARVRWREGDEEFTWPPILFESARQPAP